MIVLFFGILGSYLLAKAKEVKRRIDK